MTTLKDWIAIYDSVIPDELCEQCISLFENDNIEKGCHKEQWRRCIELTTLDSTPLWEQIKSIIKQQYDIYRREHSQGVLNWANTLEAANMYRYDVDVDNPNLFNSHADSWNMPTSSRQLSVILYLNDVTDGGATNFINLDLSVAPKKGRIIMFPPFYNFIHKGEPPISNSKYIIVSWIHFDGSGHAYRVHKM